MDTQLKKTAKEIKVDIIVGCKQWSVGHLNEKLDDLLHSAVEEQRKQLEKEIEMLIVEELLIANKEGQPTSRLTSLAVKIKNLSHKKETKK